MLWDDFFASFVGTDFFKSVHWFDTVALGDPEITVVEEEDEFRTLPLFVNGEFCGNVLAGSPAHDWVRLFNGEAL